MSRSPTTKTTTTSGGGGVVEGHESPTPSAGTSTPPPTTASAAEPPCKWGHYKNFQQVVRSLSGRKPLDLLFKSNVLITEKLDGSNLGIWIKYRGSPDGDQTDVKQWEIYSLQGRNQPLWCPALGKGENTEESLLDLPVYGFALNLEKLPFHMRDFAVKLANKLQVTEIEVFGESFRAKKTKKSNAGNILLEPSPHASWHPFGYKLPQDEWKVVKLNTEVHKLFSSVSTELGMPTPADHQTVFETLLNTDRHLVFPPPAYFSGPLHEGIENLHPLMMSTGSRGKEGCDPLFEGFFVIAEDGSVGFKWKTGIHDEQKDIMGVEALVRESKEVQRWYALTADIYHTKVRGEKKERPKVEKVAKTSTGDGSAPTSTGGSGKLHVNDRLQIEADIKTAYEREMSKTTSFAHLVPNDRLPIADQLADAVFKEVVEQYEEAELPLSVPAKGFLGSAARSRVKTWVMQVEKTAGAPAEEKE